MSLEQALNRWGIHTHKKVAVATTKVITPEAPVIKKDLTPRDYLLGENEAVERAIVQSLNPREPISGEVVFMADQPSGELYVCNKNDRQQAAFWLDPGKWQDTLAEFGDFIQSGGGSGVNIKIKTHEAEAGSYPRQEWVLVTPVKVENGAEKLGTVSTYGITQDGRVTLSSPQTSVVDLGFLNPARVKRMAIENFHAGLGR